jgi:hypothetical protein
MYEDFVALWIFGIWALLLILRKWRYDRIGFINGTADFFISIFINAIIYCNFIK